MPYGAHQMYELVADVAAYPKFLPWCAAARIISLHDVEQGREMTADLVVSFKVFRERFGSKVLLQDDDLRIETHYVDGPFRYMHSTWAFSERDDGGCDVAFFVDFEFKNKVLRSVIGVVFNEAMHRIVRAFEARAEALYGSSPEA